MTTHQATRLRTLVATALGCAALGIGSIVAATPQPTTYRGTPLLSGGVGEEEREAMRQEAASFNLWLTIVEQGSGNYVAGVRVTVEDANANPVLDVVADGPWLFAQLPAGRYTVRTADGRALPVTVSATGRTASVLRVAPEPAATP